MSDLAAEYSICPSNKEGGMLGWVKLGKMVPEFEEAAFSAEPNHVVRCKTQFGWHLLQVLSEREPVKDPGGGAACQNVRSSFRGRGSVN